MAADQLRRARQRHHRIYEQLHPRRRNVHEHDAHALALLVVGRRHDEGEDQTDDQKTSAQPAKPGQRRGAQSHEAGRIGESMHDCPEF